MGAITSASKKTPCRPIETFNSPGLRLPAQNRSATVLTEQRNGETYALLMLVASDTATDDATPRMPRDLTFIIDTSGSMAGPSIEQAKSALASSLTG